MDNLFLNFVDLLLKSIPAFISAFVAVLMYKMSKKQNEFIKNSEKNKNTPYLFPIKDEFKKSKWIRFRCGQITLNGNFPSKTENELNKQEKEYVDFCKANPNSVFLYYLDNNLHFVLNGYSGMPAFVIEHHNTEITLVNYGAIISKIHIDQVKIHYTNNKEKIYEGLDNNYYTNVILTNGELKIILDEVVDSNILNEQSFCYINPEVYENLTDNMDLFTSNAPHHLIYDKFTITLTIWNQNNESSTFDIIIKKSGDQFQREVILIS